MGALLICWTCNFVSSQPSVEAVPSSAAWSHLFLFVLWRLGQHGGADAFPRQKQDIAAQGLDYSVFKMLASLLQCSVKSGFSKRILNFLIIV